MKSIAGIFFSRFIGNAGALAASGLGLGRAPFASGTFGALPGCLIVWALTAARLDAPQQAAACAALAALSIPVCSAGERRFGGKDPGQVVADEFLTFPICMIGLYDKWQDAWWLMPVCFAVSRVMDIIKPFPAYRSQKLRGGLGITIDDAIANLYALAANHLIWKFFG